MNTRKTGLALAGLVLVMMSTAALGFLALSTMACESGGAPAGNGQMPTKDGTSCTMACGTDNGSVDGSTDAAEPETSASQFGSLVVTSTPDGAAISLDGTPTGKITPAEIKDVKFGEHTVKVSLPDFDEAERTVNVPAGKSVYAGFNLIPTQVSLGMYHVWQKLSGGPDDPGGDVYEWDLEVFSTPALHDVQWSPYEDWTWHCTDDAPGDDGWIHGECISPEGAELPYKRQPDFKKIEVGGPVVTPTGATLYLQVRADKK